MKTVLQNRSVVTRKPHQCFACLRDIPVGDEAQLIVQVDNGEFDRMYWCAVCSEYWNRYALRDDEIHEGELKANDPEGWEEVRREVEEEK